MVRRQGGKAWLGTSRQRDGAQAGRQCAARRVTATHDGAQAGRQSVARGVAATHDRAYAGRQCAARHVAATHNGAQAGRQWRGSGRQGNATVREQDGKAWLGASRQRDGAQAGRQSVARGVRATRRCACRAAKRGSGRQGNARRCTCRAAKRGSCRHGNATVRKQGRQSAAQGVRATHDGAHARAAICGSGGHGNATVRRQGGNPRPPRRYQANSYSPNVRTPLVEGRSVKYTGPAAVSGKLRATRS